MPVAFEIAREFECPLDVLLVRKLGAPRQPELAIGAIAEGDFRVIDKEVVGHLGIKAVVVETIEARERLRLAEASDLYKSHRPDPALDGRRVVIVDDGIATGSTMEVAARAARHRGADHVVLAAPVASDRAIERLRPVADQVVVLESSNRFLSISQFYADFSQVSDGEVNRLLDEINRSDP